MSLGEEDSYCATVVPAASGATAAADELDALTLTSGDMHQSELTMKRACDDSDQGGGIRVPAHKRIAVTGVSRAPGNHGSNVVYKRLRERGCEVFAVNPNADEVEGDRAYHDLHAIPGGVEAVVIATRPEIADDTIRECAELFKADHPLSPNVHTS